MGARGPMGKPIAELKLLGTFRKDRHAARAAIPDPSGKPVKPRGFKGERLAEWNRITAELANLGTSGKADTSLIIAACNEWAKYCEMEKVLELQPINKEARCASRTYFDAWIAVRAKLGMTPIDRSRVKSVNPVEQKQSTISSFARKRG